MERVSVKERCELRQIRLEVDSDSCNSQQTLPFRAVTPSRWPELCDAFS